MAERSTGPVKPPVIDLTARSANARPESVDTPRDAEPEARRPVRMPIDFGDANWPLLGLAALGGAVLGTILTYLLASAVPLLSRQQGPDLAPELVAQSERLDALSAGLSALQQSAGRTQISLDATITQLDTGLAAVNQSIADVRAAMPEPAAPVDLSAIETELRTLKAQVDAIAAGASGADASVIAQSLASLETGMSSLTTRLNGVDSTVASLRTDLDAARQALGEHINAALPNEVGPALKLPLILSGLEAAFAAGRPFQPELDALRGVLPDFVVSDSLAAAAPTGLTRPDILLRRFEDAVPDILAARDTANADWTQSAIDWAKSLLALRPADEVEGNTPDAVVTRLESAMIRRDYAAATALFAQLPAPMQAAAAVVAADIRVHAEADGLVDELRTRALASTAAP